jgi:hypothetical protein
MAGDPECAAVFEDGVHVAGAAVIAFVAQDDAVGRGAGPGVGVKVAPDWRAMTASARSSPPTGPADCVPGEPVRGPACPVAGWCARWDCRMIVAPSS